MPGHIGINKLREIIQEEYVGITLKDVTNFIKICKGWVLKSKPEKIVSCRPICVEDVHQRLMCDLIDFEMYCNDNMGYKYAFTLIDCFTKFAFVFPIKDKTGKTIKEILENLFYTEGAWNYLHTDNGREFENGEVKKFM